MTEDWQSGGFGIYIHWPFCQAKCPYCDFNSHVSHNIDQKEWLRAYLVEIDRVAALVPGRIVNSVFFGGGTPSLMDPETVDAVLERIRLHWPQSNDLEVTLEANPGSVEAGRFQAYSECGVSRISMGVQALNDTDLRRLGRLHSVAEARQAFDIAKKFYQRVSFDLIYARQDQTQQDWQAELNEALSMAVDHLSLYQLTIEPGTVFNVRHEANKLRGLPTDDAAADMYLLTQDLCANAGMPAYEVSNHAASGSESRHNLIYWRYGDYAGIGPGAHGRLTLNGTRHAVECWKQPDKWLEAVSEGSTEKNFEALDPKDQANEYLMMGLRIAEGIDIKRFNNLSPQKLSTVSLNYLQELDLIEQTDHHIRTTAKGRPILNSIIAELLLE